MKALVALLSSAVLLGACGQRIEADNADTIEPVPAVKAAPVSTQPAAPATSYKTSLYSERDADVTARMEGVVRSVTAELGDAVPANAVLASLENERQAAAVQSAQAALELARNERTRAAALRSTEMITQAELDAAIYRERTAEAAARTAEVELGYTRVRAPFAGRVAERFVRIGQTVRVGDPLFRVTAPAPLRAAVRIPEQDARALAKGETVTLIADDGSPVAGRIARIAPAIDPASGTIEVLIDVAQPRGLRPGSAVTLAVAGALRKAAQ